MFAGIDYSVGAKVVYYRGRIKTKLDYLVRSLNHEYGVYMGRDFVLDCYESATEGLCKASRVNSPKKLSLKIDETKKVVANLKLSVNIITRKAYLVAIKKISSGEELFVDYERILHLLGKKLITTISKLASLLQNSCSWASPQNRPHRRRPFSCQI